jgi:hypothetical protein
MRATYYVKAWDVVGFTADADVWCRECAADVYGADVLTDRTVADGEGNPVRPIFASDLGQWECHCGMGPKGSGPHCGQCGADVGA